MADLQISRPVGIRDGKQMLPNLDADMALVKARLERISTLEGGSRERPLWLIATTRDLRIIELTAAITLFQTAQIANGKLKARKPDGAVDPGGGTYRRLAALAGPDPDTPRVVIFKPMGVQVDPKGEGGSVFSVDPATVAGTAPLRPSMVKAEAARALVHMPGYDIEWFGVSIPKSVAQSPGDATPMIFFTPLPGQAGIPDFSYKQFAGTAWEGLWERYTRKIGAQVAASGARVITVFPFYPSGRMTNFGRFNDANEEVIEAVITAAALTMDPLCLRDTFDMGLMVTASFSNGIWAHQHFMSSARAVATNLKFSISFDSHMSPWRPPKAICYWNKGAPPKAATAGPNDWYVGGRFSQFCWAVSKDVGTNDHNRCPALMWHAMSTMAR